MKFKISQHVLGLYFGLLLVKNIQEFWALFWATFSHIQEFWALFGLLLMANWAPKFLRTWQHWLALPFSNSAVERAFSQMNLIKTKFRNRMQQDMLEALLRIRGYMARNNICCNTLTTTSGMLERFTTHIYENVEAEDRVLKSSNFMAM